MVNLPSSFDTHNVMFVNITQSYSELLDRKKRGLSPVKGRENIYECTRKYWKLSKAHADMADYVAGAVKNENGIFVIRSVYEFADKGKWRKVWDCPDLADDEEVLENSDHMNRFAFVGKEPSEDIKELFIGKCCPFVFKRQPVRYNFD